MTTPQNESIEIRPEPTPNPASVRFVLSRPVVEGGTVDLKSAAEAGERSPLAARLFKLAAVEGVFLGTNFVTITANPEAQWNSLAASVIETIKEGLAAGDEPLIGEPDPAPEATHSTDEVTQGIVRIINEEIRPAVAMDGGDIVFGGYQNGVVQLHLRGSCHGCPSSLMTLKMGIERRLQEDYPEIMAVEAI